MTTPLRTVVWSTGGVGSVAVDAIRRRRDLDLVGVWVHSDEKVGRDAGELAGGDPICVAATNDADALIALKPEYYPILVKHVTAARVARHFKGMISGPVERFELPNLHALNFLLHGALDGGGTISLKTDAQGKVLSTALLRLELQLRK